MVSGSRDHVRFTCRNRSGVRTYLIAGTTAPVMVSLSVNLIEWGYINCVGMHYLKVDLIAWGCMNGCGHLVQNPHAQIWSQYDGDPCCMLIDTLSVCSLTFRACRWAGGWFKCGVRRKHYNSTLEVWLSGLFPPTSSS